MYLNQAREIELNKWLLGFEIVLMIFYENAGKHNVLMYVCILTIRY